MGSVQHSTERKGQNSTIPGSVIAASIGCLVLFAVIVAVLLDASEMASERTWSRMVYVYGGVEAVVFGAAGALFGTSIQRGQTRAAEQRATDAKADARTAGEAANAAEASATAGRALRAAVDVEAEAAASRGPALRWQDSVSPGLASEKVGSDSSAPDASNEASPTEALGRLQRLAEKLFDE